jgi:hypothetical protein
MSWLKCLRWVLGIEKLLRCCGEGGRVRFGDTSVKACAQGTLRRGRGCTRRAGWSSRDACTMLCEGETSRARRLAGPRVGRKQPCPASKLLLKLLLPLPLPLAQSMGVSQQGAETASSLEQALRSQPAPPQQPQQLSLPGSARPGGEVAQARMPVPGLSNEAGEYNCFLNAILQCLWHCRDFRQQVWAGL